jgi:hypothetical protein
VKFERVFENKKVRFLTVNNEISNEVLMPLPDIAKALDYDKKALRDILKRNKEIFESWKVVTTLQVDGQGRKTTCLNRDGVTGLLMKLSTGRIKNQTKKQMIVNFQRWAIRTISEVMQGVSEILPAEQIYHSIQEEIRSQGQLLLVMHKQLEILTQAVTVLVQQATRQDKHMIPMPQAGLGEDVKFTMSIKRQQNQNGRRINYKVERLGLAEEVTSLLQSPAVKCQ